MVLVPRFCSIGMNQAAAAMIASSGNAVQAASKEHAILQQAWLGFLGNDGKRRQLLDAGDYSHKVLTNVGKLAAALAKDGMAGGTTLQCVNRQVFHSICYFLARNFHFSYLLVPPSLAIQALQS